MLELKKSLQIIILEATCIYVVKFLQYPFYYVFGYFFKFIIYYKF